MRERVQKKHTYEHEPRGRGWHGDSLGHRDAGRKGGRVSTGKFVEGSERAKEAGRKGGMSK